MKGVLFTLISVILAALFVAMFSIDIQSIYSGREVSGATRIEVLDTYVKNFEIYTDASVKIAAYRSLDSLYNYAIISGKFFNSSTEFNAYFADCMRCGYMNCSTLLTQCASPMPGNDLKSLLKNISNLAVSNLNIYSNYSINSVKIYQLYPFDVQIELNISYNVSDGGSNNYASWSKNRIVNESVSISGLRDPLVGVYNKTYLKPIIESSICKYNESCWNYNSTLAFYASQQFRFYPNGTSYLQRFYNSSQPSSCCGMESLMNITYTSGFNTHVDYMYRTNTYLCPPSNTSIFMINISGPAAGLMLDAYSANRYGVIPNSTRVCPIS